MAGCAVYRFAAVKGWIKNYDYAVEFPHPWLQTRRGWVASLPSKKLCTGLSFWDRGKKTPARVFDLITLALVLIFAEGKTIVKYLINIFLGAVKKKEYILDHFLIVFVCQNHIMIYPQLIVVIYYSRYHVTKLFETNPGFVWCVQNKFQQYSVPSSLTF